MLCSQKKKDVRKQKGKHHSGKRTDLKTSDLDKSETPNENKDNIDKVSLDKDCELPVEYQTPDVTVSTLECTNPSDSVSEYQTPECSQPVMSEDYDDAVDVSSMLDNFTMRTDHIYPLNVTNLQQMHSLKVQDDVDTIGLECSDVSEDSSKLLNYDMLLNEVKICSGNTVQPSAPAADFATTQQLQEAQETYFNPLDTSYKEETNSTLKQNVIIKLQSELNQETLTLLSEEELSQFYYNSELSQAPMYVDEFVKTEVNNDSKMVHPFYILLSNYLKAKMNVQLSMHKITDLSENIEKYISGMWTVSNDVQVCGVGKCADGNSVSVKKNYTVAKFNHYIFEDFKTTLLDIRATLFEILKVDSFNCLQYKLKINLYIENLLRSCPEFTNLNDSSPISLVETSSDSYFQKCLSNLRISIGILFLFQREQRLDMSSSFLEESREWLTDLVSVLIRVGSWKDHLFLLSHILRCPGSVGKWASPFIQFPRSASYCDPFSNPIINHMMTVMSILLQPVDKREDFMNHWKTLSASDEHCWVIVDSDDEDDESIFLSSPLKENDMVLLLNQIPLRNLFESILGLEKGKLNPEAVTADHLMKLFSFSLDFIKILHTGLQVYSTQRYKQFARRLGRLIRHIIEYTTFELDLFRSKHKNIDCLERLLIEYDNFFLKSAESIYSSRKHGTWQFLAVIPFHRVSRNGIIKLYSILQLTDKNTKCNFEINLSDFEETFQKLPESEQFYLLSTFKSMALARDLTELDFIRAVIHQLLHVGFLSSLTMDRCYKNVKSLLYDLCSKHSFLMSDILRLQNEYFTSNEKCDQSLSIHLWKDLPLKTWKPSLKDIEVLSSWLLQPLQSVRNELGRIIFKSLNYGCEEELFLPFETHRTIAFAVMRANIKLSQIQEASVIKNVSSFVRLPEPMQNFQSWSWNLLLTLHLHLLDQSIYSVKNSFRNLNENLQNIPELPTISELHRLTEQRDPIACFIALMTTSVGHSVPVIFNTGFSLIEVLIRAQKYEAAIACLEHITLMFYDCQESLLKCQGFGRVLSQLLNADHSHLNLANSLRAFESPGPTLLCVENMIQSQIRSCQILSIDVSVLIELWMKSLTRLPLWTQEPAIIYLLDSLCKIAFWDQDMSHSVNSIFSDLLAKISSPTKSRSSISALVSWMNSKTSLPMLLPRGYDGNATWFFLKAIDVEQEIYESGNHLWMELLKELYVWEKKTNVDSCLKKVCSNLQIQTRTSEVLVIYRLCYQILETSITHPVLVLLWQRFFLLYFQRVPGHLINGSIGEKFFHGIVNQNLFKRLKRRLKESCDCFSELYNQTSECEKKEHFLKCAKVFQVFQLWLDEAKLHESHLSVHLLPPLFNPELFGTVIRQDKKDWIEYVECQQIRKEINRSVLAWQELKGRRNKTELSRSHKDQEKSLIDRIEEGLVRYENPIPAPLVNIQKYSFSNGTGILLNFDSVESYIQPSFKTILNYADFYNQEVGKYVALCCEMQELAQTLYTIKNSSMTVTKKCSGCKEDLVGEKASFDCSGPAVITLNFKESEKDSKNNGLFDLCLKNLNQNLQQSLLPVQQDVIISVVTVEKFIEELKTEYLMRNKIGDEKLMLSLRKTGTKLFYDFIHSWSESVSCTPTIAQIFESSLEILGQTFMADNVTECDSLLNVINQSPKLTGKIKEYFNPNICSTKEFIDLYSKVKISLPEIRLVLLSRFKLTEWLVQKRPRFTERSLLISEIGAGLKSHGPCPTEHLGLIEVFNSHLQQLLMYDFPEHYGEVLNLLLDGSEAQVIPVSTWFMFINSLVPKGIHFVEGKNDKTGQKFEPGQSVKKLKVCFTQYATLQKFLSLADIRETILHLANAFKMDRLKHGLYGLYPKYHHYVEVILIFYGMLSHAYVAETLKLDLGSLSSTIAEQIWPLLRDLYSPWLAPYWSKHERAHAAEWIQELTDDKIVLLPWLSTDAALASHCCGIFIESIRFIVDTLPGTNTLLNHIWLFYVTNYAHIQIKDHILRIVHKNLLHLPWYTFFPSLQDIELMVRVVEHFIPMSHTLLGSIFIQVRWTDVIEYYSKQCDVETLGKLHAYLLHLLVKLPCEPSLKQKDEVMVLLTQAKDYSWHLVDSGNYDSVLNWFVMSSDPRIVLMDEQSDSYKLDHLILQILRICAGYSGTPKDFHPTTITKRLLYIRASSKWLVTAENRFKCKHSRLFKSAIFRILEEIESAISLSISDSQKSNELVMLMSEFLNILKEDALNSVLEEVIIQWLSTEKSCVLIYGLMRSIALSSASPVLFGNVAEACIECYFLSKDDSNWTEIVSKFVTYASGHSGLQKALMNSNNILTLNAILVKHLNDTTSLLEKKIIISDIFLSFSSAKKCEIVEPKLVLMLLHTCQIAQSMVKLDEAEGASILARLSRSLVAFVNDKGNGFLSAIGLKKTECFTNRFKFICLIACEGITKILKSNYPTHADKIDDRVLKSIDLLNTSKQYLSLSQSVNYNINEMNKIATIEDLINVVKRLGFQIYRKNYLK